nr:hypothetical protein HK105_004193 [Polyrhizophydium stewartii]
MTVETCPHGVDATPQRAGSAPATAQERGACLIEHPAYSLVLELWQLRDDAQRSMRVDSLKATLLLVGELLCEYGVTIGMVCRGASGAASELGARAGAADQGLDRAILAAVVVLVHQIVDACEQRIDADEAAQQGVDGFVSESEFTRLSPFRTEGSSVSKKALMPYSLDVARSAGPDSPGSNAKPKRPNHSKEVHKVLRDWLDAHRSHPYPSEDAKKHMCNVTGLNLTQLNNWFINARRRYLVKKTGN